jgi:hypothetical protein
MVAWGGGIYGFLGGPGQDVNGSYPIVSGGVATGWQGYMDNSTGSDLDFQVFAICAQEPTDYSVMKATFSNPIGTQNSAAVICPLDSKGKKPTSVLGGGAVGSSPVIGQDLNTSAPEDNGWLISMNNDTVAQQAISVYVICGKVKTRIRRSDPVPAVSGAQTGQEIACKGKSVPTGGGVASNSSSTHASVNSTFPESHGWGIDEDNTSGSPDTIFAFVICVNK